MRCGGMQDEAMSQPRAACTTCSQVGPLATTQHTLSLLYRSTPRSNLICDPGQFLGTLTTHLSTKPAPQYPLLPRDPPLSVGRSRAAIPTQRPGKPPSTQRLNTCLPCLRWHRHWARILYLFYLSLRLLRSPASGVLTEDTDN
jgi:hypothetical protein